jgi:hypothetical protein
MTGRDEDGDLEGSEGEVRARYGMGVFSSRESDGQRTSEKMKILWEQLRLQHIRES